VDLSRELLWIEILTSPPPPKPDVRMAAVAFTTRNAVALERYLAAHGITAELPPGGVHGIHAHQGALLHSLCGQAPGAEEDK
jgi:hypothetical protein